MPVDEPRALALLLPRLASLLAEVPLDAPVAVGVVLEPQPDLASTEPPAVEFYFRHLDCTDVVCALGGFVAPTEWHAFGVVAPGRRLLLDTPVADRLDDSVTVCALLARTGQVVSEVRTLHGEVLSHGISSGRAVDACRRVLGLDTAPPLLGPHVWRTLRWIDRVLAAVLDADLGDPPSWPVLGALRVLDEPDRFLFDDDDDDDDDDRRGTCADWSWPELRDACAHGEVSVPCIDADTAAWMDDGLFAREAIAAFPPLVTSLGDLRQLLPPNTFEKIVEQVSRQLAA